VTGAGTSGPGPWETGNLGVEKVDVRGPGIRAAGCHVAQGGEGPGLPFRGPEEGAKV
jgi:hypothetical protein